MSWFKNFRTFLFRAVLFIFFLLLPLPLFASFIESTIGTAVVNDATASYYNPAALTLLTMFQIIGLDSYSYFRTQFTGQAKQLPIGFSQSGSSSAQTHYYLPSVYLGMPTRNNVKLGLAVISNDFDRDAQENSILRYVQSNNHIQNIDVVPALGIKLNDFFAVGVGLNFSYAKFVLKPIFGIRSLTIPDSHSLNEANAWSFGGDVGFLLKLTQSTLIGFNYRSAIRYRLSGKSVFLGNPKIISNDYHFKFFTPARSVISISQFVTKKLGFIATFQHIESKFKNITIFGIATPLGILPKAIVPYHLHNSWILTLGSQYYILSKWVVRIAASYVESPANGNFQISNGDSIILGGSTGYRINKKFTIDGSYAHAFIKNKNIHIKNTRNIIDGVNKGFRDSISLKLTFNL